MVVSSMQLDSDQPVDSDKDQSGAYEGTYYNEKED